MAWMLAAGSRSRTLQARPFQPSRHVHEPMLLIVPSSEQRGESSAAARGVSFRASSAQCQMESLDMTARFKQPAS